MPSATLSIGDFSRATQMSVKMLRHYHQIGLLEPADIDPDTSYRRYTADQIPAAQVIRRFRSLEMPLGQIREVLAAPDPATRNALIASHLDALQASLTQTQTVVASLRNLLDGPPEDRSMPVTHRTVEATAAAAITEPVAIAELELWVRGALGELRAALTAQDLLVAAPAAGIYDDDLFAHEHGQATVFIPYVGELEAIGRVQPTVIPAAELATVTHHGPLSGIDLAYGALAAYVARHELGIDGPIREYYTVADTDTPNSSAWRTEIGLPIFSTGQRS
ncbi:MAG TPA: MerR family transcriptional regulator [Solirubrobacteraceae bacterium]|jgi:DNA-binding transcriptional MerR regulator